ncbi:MAG TPA: nucleoside-diphosphate sugar epimerase/dehydratase, partial [Gemmatimonadaceae bacterium]|nr:nucleoside-diphosphate sugar epimerase/dehydratase [Gemmatimonadaceae bacterium]
MHTVRRFTLRNRHLLVWDLACLLAAPTFGYWARLEGWHWAPADVRTAILYTLVAPPLKLAVFLALALYHRLWRQATLDDLRALVLAGLLSAVVGGLVGGILLPATRLAPLRVPISVLCLDAFVTMTALVLPRLAMKSRATRRARRPAGSRRALIAGAGAGGEMMAKELLGNPQLALEPVGFVDDDPAKQTLRLCGLPILGRLADIPAVVRRWDIEEIVIAMPTASGAVIRAVLQAAREAGVHTRTVPGLFEILSERVSVSHLRRVEIQDLLRRAPIWTDLDDVRGRLRDRPVLVTGAGGTIGGELCRQLATLEPSVLVLLGHGENSIFEIQRELQLLHPTLPVVPVIADVRDRTRLDRIFAQFRPVAAFHTAAHKHVPLMETNVGEAVCNNIGGTINVAQAAAAAGVAHLVLVSTDKAVSCRSTMGATKRLAELMVQHLAGEHGCDYVAVRFGNVLGSRGSVVPIFLRQLEAGGPITITHPEMTRYFMTIPEAVQLILQAGGPGEGGHIFVLDMGAPVKIVDLATDLVRLSGLEPGRDIEFRFTGLRPGEELHERLLFAHERVSPTPHPKILRIRAEGVSPDAVAAITSLVHAARQGRPEREVQLRLEEALAAS